MGRIITSVSLENLSNPGRRIRCDALVDIGASHVVLPSAWRDRLGELEELETVELELANQQAIEGVICGPVRIQIEDRGFPCRIQRGALRGYGAAGRHLRTSDRVYRARAIGGCSGYAGSSARTLEANGSEVRLQTRFARTGER